MVYLTRRLVESAKRSPILLTGSSGYLGTELSEQLRLAGVEFTGVDREPGSPPEGRLLNLADEGPVRALFEAVCPRTVIHSGTHSALAYRDDFIGSFKEDLLAVSNILQALAGDPAARLVFFSSSYVYSGLDSVHPVDEGTAPNPSHNFGVAKLFFEQFVLRNHPNSVVFRLSSVFGHGVQRHPNAIANMVAECRTNGRLTVWGEGKRRMQYVFLEDVVLGILEAITLPPGLYNLGGVDYTSVASTAGQIARFFGAEVEFLSDKREGDTVPFMQTEKLCSSAPEYRSNPLTTALGTYLSKIPR